MMKFIAWSVFPLTEPTLQVSHDHLRDGDLARQIGREQREPILQCRTVFAYGFPGIFEGTGTLPIEQRCNVAGYVQGGRPCPGC
jgi:hypothetical protein